MKNTALLRSLVASLLLAAALVPAVRAQTATEFTTIISFSSSGGIGYLPQSGLTQGSDGNFYGSASQGGTNGRGTVFQATSTGSVTALHEFSNIAAGNTNMDGAYPYGGAILASDGNVYGTAQSGGAGGGTVYQITTAGVFTTLYTFNGSDGAAPEAGLIEGIGGNFYGTTTNGGTYGYGTVFKITSTGTLTTLRNFSGSDGAYPQASLIQDSVGNLYGTTRQGGAGNVGTVFKITPTGTFNILHSFVTTDGAYLDGSVVQDSAGNFYGTTEQGGDSGNGTVFMLAPGGSITTLYSFENGADGRYPEGGLAMTSNGTLYGATYFGGGGAAAGEMFSITPDGTFTVVHQLGSKNNDGIFALGNLLAASDGNIYGVTEQGGALGEGTIYQINPAAPIGAFQFSASSVSVNETSGTATLFIKRNGLAGAVTVTCSTSDGSATAGTDYTSTSQTLSWADGDTSNKLFRVPILDAGVSGGGTRMFTVTLSAPTGGASLGSPSTATVVITDNDPATPTPGTPTPTPTPGGTPTPTPTPTVAPTQPTVTLTSPPDGLAIVAGANLPLAASVVDPDTVLANVQFFIDGNAVATVSAEPFVFNASAPTVTGNHVVQAVATDLLGRANTSSATVAVTAAVAAAPPTASVLTPVAGRSLPVSTVLALSVAAAADVSTALDHVNLYANGTLVATFVPGDSSTQAAPAGSPTRRAATAAASNVFQTSFTLPGTDQIVNMVAVALDKLGQSTISRIASIHATATTDHPPLVTLGGLSDGGHVEVGSTSPITVTPTAATTSAISGPGKTRRDATGTLALLEYYLNGAKLGQATQPPYTFSFTPPSPGKYVLHAVATDAAGLSSITTPITVTADAPPTVSLATGGGAVTVGTNGVIVVSRTGDTSAPLTVLYKAKGAAVAGVDYKKLPGSITIPAGAVKAKLKVKPLAGLSSEAGVLKLKVQLLAPTDGSYEVGTGTVKIKLVGE